MTIEQRGEASLIIKEDETVFIGVAWPYVNGELHIGHLAGYLLPADICARFHRATGKKVLMVSGSDCYGTPITIEADKKGVSPKEIADIYHAKHEELLLKTLDLSYDIYTRTDTEHHQEVVQEVFVELLNKGYISVDTQQQYFSPSENRFLPDRYVVGTCTNCGSLDARSDQCDNCGKVLDQGDLLNPQSKLSGQPVELRDTEHYFLDWPKLQPRIEEYVAAIGPQWKRWVYQETMGWLNQGLKPRAISRDLNWGVPLPEDRIPKHLRIEGIARKRLYVWFDAVIGYLSASRLWAEQNGVDWKSFWHGDNLVHIYFMGKDNLPFHTMFWPGQLVGYDSGMHLPDLPSVNMFLNLEGRQFSKSRGVSISLEDMVKHFGNDPVRFHLTFIMPEAKDASFRWKEFVDRHNEVLVGNLGNFINRVLSIARGVDISAVARYEIAGETEQRIRMAFDQVRRHITRCSFRSYLHDILSLSTFGNRIVDREQLWSLKNSKPTEFQRQLKQHYAIIIALAYLSWPLMPDTSRKIFEMLGLQQPKYWPEEGIEAGHIASLVENIDGSIKPTILFKKLRHEDIEAFNARG